MATEFHYFPLLPFEIRELIWEQAAFQPAGGNPRFFKHTSTRNSTATAEGEWAVYQERGRRAPAIAHACRQARVVALKHESCCRAKPPKTARGREFWEVRLDAIILHSISPNILLGNASKLVAKSSPSIALHMRSFLDRESSALYLFEFMKRISKHSSFGAKVVVQDIAVRLTGDKQTELFGEKRDQVVQLVNVKNTSVHERFLREFRLRELVWPDWDRTPQDLRHQLATNFDHEASRAYAQQAVRELENLWLHCQYSAYYPKDVSMRKEVLGNEKGNEYNRSHPWVQRTLERMPRYEAVTKFRAICA